jgi:hypothetical protein
MVIVAGDLARRPIGHHRAGRRSANRVREPGRLPAYRSCRRCRNRPVPAGEFPPPFPAVAPASPHRCTIRAPLNATREQPGSGRSRSRAVGLGEIDMGDVAQIFLEEGAMPAPGVIDDLIRETPDTRRHIVANTAHRRHRDDLFDAEPV